MTYCKSFTPVVDAAALDCLRLCCASQGVESLRLSTPPAFPALLVRLRRLLACAGKLASGMVSLSSLMSPAFAAGGQWRRKLALVNVIGVPCTGCSASLLLVPVEVSGAGELELAPVACHRHSPSLQLFETVFARVGRFWVLIPPIGRTQPQFSPYRLRVCLPSQPRRCRLRACPGSSFIGSLAAGATSTGGRAIRCSHPSLLVRGGGVGCLLSRSLGVLGSSRQPEGFDDLSRRF